MKFIVKGLVVLVVALLTVQVTALSLDQAVSQLKTFQFGEETETLSVIQTAVTQTMDQPAARQKLAQGLAQILKTSASYDAKQFVCRQLAVIGTDQQVPALARLLPDKALSHMARFALARIPGDAADQALIEALDKTKGREQLGLVNTLGNRRSVLAIPALEPLLQATDNDLKAQAMTAVGRIASSQSPLLLIEVTPPAGSSLQAVWAQACLTCADRLQTTGDTAQAVTLYKKLYRSPIKAIYRAAAFQRLCDQIGDFAFGPVLDALRSPEPPMHQMAVNLARHLGGVEVTQSLIYALPNLPAPVQVELILALGDRGDVTALPVIVKQCNHTQDHVRQAALEALGQLGNQTTVGLLAQHATDDTPACRTTAQKSLDRLRGQGIDPEIMRQLTSASPAIQVSLIGALENRNAVMALPDLFKLVQSRAPAVTKAAIQALRELAGPKDLPELVTLLTQVPPRDWLTLQRLIVFLAQKYEAQSQTTDLLLQSLNSQIDLELRSCLLTSAGTLGQKSTLPILTRALKDTHPKIRDAAIRSLSDWPDASPAHTLLEIAQTTDLALYRTLALRGYIRMTAANPALTPAQAMVCYETALDLCTGPAEKRQILSALSNVQSVDALTLALSMTDDPDLSQDAAMAVTEIASRILAQDPKAVQQALERVVTLPVQDAILAQARKTLADLEALKNIVLNWEVAGPYTKTGKNCSELFDIRFGPEILGNDVTWRPMPMSASGYLDLLQELNGGVQRVAYLRTTIQTASALALDLEIFSDDGVKAWIDGDLIHANNVMRPIMPDPDRVKVTLEPGTHRLLLKVTQNDQPWGAIVRTGEQQDTPVQEEVTGEGFRLHIINADSQFEAAGVLDVNGDGQLDVLSGGFWYAAPHWQKLPVREIVFQNDYYNDFADLPMDVDGDGRTDIVSAAYFDSTLRWIRNAGPNADPQFQEIFIDKPGAMETAIVVDINGDGQPDILPNLGGNPAWYEFVKDTTAEHGVRWQKHTLPAEAGGHGHGAGDVNGDGLCDILVRTGWLEQTGKRDTPWIWHPEFDLGDRPCIPILVHDVDGDSDADIIWGPGHGYGVYWLEQGQDDNGARTWKQHAIDTQWSQPHFLLLADLTLDGHKELITGKRYHAHNGHDPGGNEPLCVYYYQFDREQRQWTRHILHEGGRVGLGINTQAVDMDQDGDIDIVAPGKSGLYLFENLLK